MSELKVYEEMEDYVGYEDDTPTEMYDKSEADKLIEELKRENERLARCCKEYDTRQHIDETIKFNGAKQLRSIKYALWLARASGASSFASLFSTLSDISDDESRTYWIFGNKRKIVIDGLKCSRMETAYKWFCIWDDVANKCLKKAEKYK